MLDLALRGRIDVMDGKVVVTEASPTSDLVLDALLARIAADPKRRAPKHWVTKAQKGARAAVADRLVASGALRRESRKVLGVFPVTRLPAGDPAPEAVSRARLDGVVLRGLEPDDRTAGLAALVHVTGLQRAVFPDSDRKMVKARPAKLATGAWVATAVQKAVQDTAAAAAAAVVVVVVAAGSSSSWAGAATPPREVPRARSVVLGGIETWGEILVGTPIAAAGWRAWRGSVLSRTAMAVCASARPLRLRPPRRQPDSQLSTVTS